MEKLITKRNLSLFGIVSFLLVIALYFILQNNSKDDEKLFDIFLAELYNEQNSNLDEKLYYLSSLDNPKVSFFSDLKLTSIENLDRYNKIDKDIILLKKALIDLDKELIKSLSLDAILEKTNLTETKIDLLDIDVEGADLRVLKGFTIEKFKPELICVEIHEKEIKNSGIYKYLSNFSYELVWSGVFSHIFKSKS